LIHHARLRLKTLTGTATNFWQSGWPTVRSSKKKAGEADLPDKTTGTSLERQPKTVARTDVFGIPQTPAPRYGSHHANPIPCPIPASSRHSRENPNQRKEKSHPPRPFLNIIYYNVATAAENIVTQTTTVGNKAFDKVADLEKILKIAG